MTASPPSTNDPACDLQYESPEVQTVFIGQAQSLCAGGELLPGGVEALAKRLYQSVKTGQPLRVKLGLDPTRPDLHLGHTVVLRKLRAFQDLGHQAILIIGDATAMVGDPSGKSQTRPPLTEAEVQANAATYLEQASKVIDVDKAEIVRNSSWLSPLTLGDFLKLAAKVTVAQILTREDFHKRYNEGRPIALHEMFYPLMQAYDSVMINADIELGGTDQRFNNLLGRELQLAYGLPDSQPEPQMVLLMPLLEGTDGKVKMSKSYPEHCINLTDAPGEMFGKMMSMPDILIQRYEMLLTPMQPEQLTEQARLMDSGQLNPRDVKVELAKWLITTYYGREAAFQAEADFVARFRDNQLPDDMPEVTLPVGTSLPLTALMADFELAPSKAEARRLIQGGGVRINQHKVADPDTIFEVIPQDGPWVLQVGKRRFLKIQVG
jgi:tyrosyl-tRNA synthetase